MKACRECHKEVSEQAVACPRCGAPYPAQPKWDGYGWEWKSRARLMGVPLVHISFKYRRNYRPVVANGVIAIGQFARARVLAVGQFAFAPVVISQFGVGALSISQFTIAAYALAQMAFAWSLIAQMGVFIHEGRGQAVISLAELLAKLF